MATATPPVSSNMVGLGGGCHWCTEAVFESLRGVQRVDQGWLASAEAPDDFSEGVLVHFDVLAIDLEALIAVHLHTHSCTSNHALRSRYRSAIYAGSHAQQMQARLAIERSRPDFDAPIVTQVLPFGAFRASDERYLHYYRKNPERPFCERFIVPKLQQVMKRFAAHAKAETTAGAARTGPAT